MLTLTLAELLQQLRDNPYRLCTAAEMEILTDMGHNAMSACRRAGAPFSCGRIHPSEFMRWFAANPGLKC